MNLFHRKKKPDPPVCGGTTRTVDENAPKTILCEGMTLFHVYSALSYHQPDDRTENGPLSFVCAYAAPVNGGTFLLLQTARFRREGKRAAWAVVKADLFPALVALAREEGLAKENGLHSHTAGLPENFGGEISVCYGDGSKISVSDNQSPVLTDRAAKRIIALFEDAMAGERADVPVAADLTGVRYDERRARGGFTKAELTFTPDGGTVRRQNKYDGPDVYESTRALSPDDVSALRETVDRCALFLWGDLPERSNLSGGESVLTFVLADGRQIAVPEYRDVPDPVRDGFFDVKFALTRS